MQVLPLFIKVKMVYSATTTRVLQETARAVTSSAFAAAATAAAAVRLDINKSLTPKLRQAGGKGVSCVKF